MDREAFAFMGYTCEMMWHCLAVTHSLHGLETRGSLHQPSFHPQAAAEELLPLQQRTLASTGIEPVTLALLAPRSNQLS